MDAEGGDPLHFAASAPCLLPRTLAPAAAAAGSPSKAFEALSQSMAQEGSTDLLDQARLTLQSHGNIQNLYRDDEGDKKAGVNGKNIRPGRRPGLGLGRKPAKFKLLPTSSNSVPVVDFSVLKKISDPDEYFSTLDRLENAEKEIRRLRGEVPAESVENHQTRNARRERRPGLARKNRKSSYNYDNYRLPLHVAASNAVEGSASQGGTLKNQAAEDASYASHPEKIKQPGAPNSSQSGLLDVLEREGSIAQMDKLDSLDELLSAFNDLDEAEEENVLRKALNLKPVVTVRKLCLPDFNFPEVNLISASSIAPRKNPLGGHNPEKTISRSPLATISNLRRRISLGDALKDQYTRLSEDDESEGSPQIGQDKQSPIPTSHDSVGKTGESSSAMLGDDERPSPSEKSPKHVLEREENIVTSVTAGKRKTRSSPSREYIHSEVTKKKRGISLGGVLKDHYTGLLEDDESEGSPQIGQDKQSTVPTSHNGVVKTGEAPSAMVVGEERPTAIDKSPDHVLELEQNIVTSGTTRQRKTRSSPSRENIHSEVTKQKRRISLGDALEEHCTDLPEDDESEGSPQNEQDKQSLIPTSHDGVGKTGDAASAMVVDEERPSPSDIAPEQLEQNILTSVTAGKRKTRSSPSREYIYSEVNQEKLASTVHNLSLAEGGDVPLDSPITEKSNHEIKDPSSHIFGPSSAEVLGSSVGRNVVPDSCCSDPGSGNILHATVKSSEQKVAVASEMVVEVEQTTQHMSSHPSEVLPADVCPENQPTMQDVIVEEQTVKICNAASPARGKKRKAAQRKNKREESNKRKSLAGAGLQWESGVRRSTRVRSRPLQHWLGERFLYGRIHDTMATVIGIKSFSPTQSGKKTAMKVKSFVPDQYADLVAEAAKY